MLGTEVANGVKIPNGVKVANGVKVKLGEAVCTNVSRSYSMISDTEELVGAADAAKKRKKADWSQADVIRVRCRLLPVLVCRGMCSARSSLFVRPSVPSLLPMHEELVGELSSSTLALRTLSWDSCLDLSITSPP